MDQRQRDIVMTRWPFRVGNGAGDDLRIDDPLLGESMVQFEVLQQRLVVRVLKTSADVLVSYSGQPEHWRPVNQTNALKDGSRISINGHVFEVHMTPWRLRGALEKDIS